MPARAQTSPSDWQFAAIIYAYFPEISGSATFPTGMTPSITVGRGQLLDSLNFAAMGAFEVRKGPWGAFTDILYMDASASKFATRDLSIGGAPLPGGITANANLSVKSTVWTLAGQYGFVSTPDVTLDLLIGTRALYLNQHLSWQFSAPALGPPQQGAGQSNLNNWDGIVGAKGRWMFGGGHAWFLPYYLDVGTGASQLTWQGYGGLGYAFSWGEIITVWRYLDWQFKSSNSSMSLNGPALGVSFRW